MTSSRSATTGETATIYRAPEVSNQAALYIAAPLIPILALVPIFAIRNDLKSGGTISTTTIIVSLVILLAILTTLWLARHQTAIPYLLISSRGLEYYGRGITIKTPWNNVREITQGTGLPSLLLHRPAATYIGPLHQRDLYTGRRIPLYLFQYSEQSNLARELRRFAPQLFGKIPNER